MESCMCNIYYDMTCAKSWTVGRYYNTMIRGLDLLTDNKRYCMQGNVHRLKTELHVVAQKADDELEIACCFSNY